MCLELLAQRLADFIVGFAVMAVGGGRALEVRNGLYVPDENVCMSPSRGPAPASPFLA